MFRTITIVWTVIVYRLNSIDTINLIVNKISSNNGSQSPKHTIDQCRFYILKHLKLNLRNVSNYSAAPVYKPKQVYTHR